MTKKVFLRLAFFLAIAVILLILAFTVFVNNNELKTQLARTKERLEKAEAEASRLQADKETTAEDNKKLMADLSSYAVSNKQLEAKEDELHKAIEELDKAIKAKEDEVRDLKEKTGELEKISAQNNASRKRKTGLLLKEREVLKNKLSSLSATLKKERAVYHYNLGVAYSQIKFYAEAVSEFEKSLAFKPDNADAHYNLGMLYANYQADPVRAKENYQKYLQLKPEAEDKKEVEGWIEKLK